MAALCIAVAGSVASLTGAVALMGISVFFMYLTGNTYWTVILDTVDEARVGGVSGFVHFVANCGGIVAPLVTGFIVQATGSFVSAFLLTGAIAVLGALGVAVFVRPPDTVLGAPPRPRGTEINWRLPAGPPIAIVIATDAGADGIARPCGLFLWAHAARRTEARVAPLTPTALCGDSHAIGLPRPAPGGWTPVKYPSDACKFGKHGLVV